MVDIRKIGGIIFEIQANKSPVKGRIWLDDMQFLTDTSAGIPAMESVKSLTFLLFR
jgi:hypothetical protein